MREFFLKLSNKAFILRSIGNQHYPIIGIDLGSHKTGFAIKFENYPTFPLGVIKNSLSHMINGEFRKIMGLHFPLAIVGLYPKNNTKKCSNLLRSFLDINGTRIDNVIYLDEAYTSKSSERDFSILVNGGEDARAAALLIETFFPLLLRKNPVHQLQ